MHPLYKIRAAHFYIDEVSSKVICQCFTVGLEEKEPMVCTIAATRSMIAVLEDPRMELHHKLAYMSSAINVHEGRTKVYNEKVDAAAELLNSIKTKSIAA